MSFKRLTKFHSGVQYYRTSMYQYLFNVLFIIEFALIETSRTLSKTV